MAYKITVGWQHPGGRFPFALYTEADQIPLTREELEALKFEIECALMETDQSYQEESADLAEIAEMGLGECGK